MLLHILTATTKMSMVSSLLYDAFEQREYAELNVTNGLGAVNHIATCSLMPLQGDERACTSEAEFKLLVARYMEATPGLRPLKGGRELTPARAMLAS